jgi:CubicO group peptidase (beta-lactamase class C family)
LIDEGRTEVTCRGSTGDKHGERPTTDVERYQQSVQAYIERVALHARIPGLSVELSSNGVRLVAMAGYTPFDARISIDSHSQFHIGDIGNMLVGLVLLQLDAEGRLDVHAPIAKYLPEFNGSSLGDELKIWHLLTHSGGYLAEGVQGNLAGQLYGWAEIVHALRNASFLFKPGTVYSYSSLGSAVLREIVNKLSGSPAGEVVKQVVLRPLGIEVGSLSQQSNAHAPPVTGATVGLPTNFTMTVRDLIDLCEFILDARAAIRRREAFISLAAALALQQQAVTMPLVSARSALRILPRTIGYGADMYKPDWYGKNGPLAGQAIGVRYHRCERIAVVVATQTYRPDVCDVVMDEILRSLGDNTRPSADTEISSAFTLEELVGDYRGASGDTLRVSQEGIDLVCNSSAAMAPPFQQFRFHSDASGIWRASAKGGYRPIGVFRDPSSYVPCLFIGSQAYKKADLT